jgi:small subunit ribosomal protein S6
LLDLILVTREQLNFGIQTIEIGQVLGACAEKSCICTAPVGGPCHAAQSIVRTSFLSQNDLNRAVSRGGAAEGYDPAYEMRLEKSGDHMPLYEHVFIARQDLSNAQAEGLIEHFGTVLSDNGGKIVDSEYWGVKTMAYKINKNRKGHYSFLRTDAPAPAVQEMERLMRLHDDVMRVMTIKVDEHAEGPSVQMQKRDERDTRRERR